MVKHLIQYSNRDMRHLSGCTGVGTLDPSIGLCFKNWCLMVLWKLGTEIGEEGWTLANEYAVVLGSLLLFSKMATF